MADREGAPGHVRRHVRRVPAAQEEQPALVSRDGGGRAPAETEVDDAERRERLREARRAQRKNAGATSASRRSKASSPAWSRSCAIWSANWSEPAWKAAWPSCTASAGNTKRRKTRLTTGCRMDGPGMRYVIGLTGNIGTGKSTVVEMLLELGADAIDADSVTRAVMRRGRRAYREIVATFGPAILDSHGQIDRAELGRRVFSDQAALRQLEEIVHPATIERITRMIELSPSSIVVIEAIKLIESGMVIRLCDALWVVTASPEQQLERLTRNRGMSREDALQRMAAQPPQAEKTAAADVLIDNSGTPAETRAQVLAAWERLPQEVRGCQRIMGTNYTDHGVNNP